MNIQPNSLNPITKQSAGKYFDSWKEEIKSNKLRISSYIQRVYDDSEWVKNRKAYLLKRRSDKEFDMISSDAEVFLHDFDMDSYRQDLLHEKAADVYASIVYGIKKGRFLSHYIEYFIKAKMIAHIYRPSKLQKRVPFSCGLVVKVPDSVILCHSDCSYRDIHDVHVSTLEKGEFEEFSSSLPPDPLEKINWHMFLRLMKQFNSEMPNDTDAAAVSFMSYLECSALNEDTVKIDKESCRQSFAACPLLGDLKVLATFIKGQKDELAKFKETNHFRELKKMTESYELSMIELICD